MDRHLPAAPTPRPTLGQVSERSRELHRSRYAAGTVTAYQGDREAWEAEGVQVPADPVAVVETLTRWHDAGLAPSTITRRAAGLATIHRAEGHPSPMEAEAVRSHLIAIRRNAAQGPKRGRGRARAMTPQELRRTVGDPVECAFPVRLTRKRAAEDRAGRAAVLRLARDRALILLGFCAALRRSEIVALDVDDVRQDGPRGLLVSIRRSKTDQEGEGATVAVPYGGLGTDTAEALEAWMMLSGITSGPLFRRVDRHGNVGEGRLTPEAANRIVQERATTAGVEGSGLSAHSLRAGYVTAQARRNTPEHRIQAVTRHRSAEVLRGYVREATVMDRAPDLALD